MKYNKSQLKIGVILNYINIGLGTLIPLCYTPIMLRLLGQGEYGLYKIASNVASYLSLVSLGIGSAVTRYLVKYRAKGDKEGEERILGLFIRIFRLIALASFILGLILTLNLHIWYSESLTRSELQRMKVLVFLMSCNTAISFSLSPYVSVVNAHEKFVFLQCMNIISTCITPIINLILLWLGYASIGMAISSLAVNVMIQSFYVFYVRRSMKVHAIYKDMPVELLKEILTFSFWVFVGNVVGQLYNATDTILIGAVPSLATVGAAVYNVGGTLNNMVLTMTTGIGNVLAPRTNYLVFSGASNADLIDYAIRIGRLQSYIITLLVSGFIVFGQPFISFYAGKGYEDAYWVAVLMMIPNIVPLVQSVCLNIIVAQNRHRFRSLVYLGIALANVIGTWVLMKSMGIVGAALMTGLALVVGQGGVMNWYYWRRIKLNIPLFWKKILPTFGIGVLLCAITLALSRIVDFYRSGIFICGIIFYTIIYIMLNWIFVMNDYEKKLISEPIHVMRNKKG